MQPAQINDWFLVRTGLGASSWNMAFDEALLEFALTLGKPVLRLYGWAEPAATFGYFQKYLEIESWISLRPLVRRPTGGGLVPHDMDWTYSIVIPPGNNWYELRAGESYRRAHDWIAESFRQLRVATELATGAAKELPGRCFIGSEKFDVLANGQKIAGAAQKRNKFGLLIQGSIQPARRDWKRADWESALLEVGSQRLSIRWTELKPNNELLSRADSLTAEKYSRKEYNQRR
jgi:lipoate-protein ligase A